MKEEIPIYNQGNIKITNLRAVFGDKTYSMSNITSVEKSKAPDSSGCFVLGLILGGILAVMFSFADGISWGALLLGVAAVGFGVFVARATKPEYVVQFGSASGEVKAYKSANQDEIKQIVEAINQAIIQKG